MKREEGRRIDRKHRFPLRIDETVHSEADALAFKHNISINLAYSEAIKFALTNDSFLHQLQATYPRDNRRGHFVYIQDQNTKKLGRR